MRALTAARDHRASIGLKTKQAWPTRVRTHQLDSASSSVAAAAATVDLLNA